jgi:hypothetical protein
MTRRIPAVCGALVGAVPATAQTPVTVVRGIPQLGFFEVVPNALLKFCLEPVRWVWVS